MLPGPAWYGGRHLQQPAVAQRAQGPARRGPRAALGRAEPAVDRQRRRRHLVRLQPLARTSRLRETSPSSSRPTDAYQVRPGSRLSRVRAGRRQVAGQAGVERLLRHRLSAPIIDGRPARSGTAGAQRHLQPGGDLGQDGHAGHRAGQDGRVTCCRPGRRRSRTRLRSTATRSTDVTIADDCSPRRRRPRRAGRAGRAPAPRQPRDGLRLRRALRRAARSPSGSCRRSTRCIWRSPTATAASPGSSNFTKVVDDFRFWPRRRRTSPLYLRHLAGRAGRARGPAGAHRARDPVSRWLSTALRFVFYLARRAGRRVERAAVAVRARPDGQPGRRRCCERSGFDSFVEVIAPGNLPAIFAIIAFWTGAGGWIVVMYGALNNISTEVIEAARIDGASAVQIALRIQLPMLRKWIAYMAILSLAAGTQLFVEPQLLSQASNGSCRTTTRSTSSPTSTRSSQNDFNGSAAISVPAARRRARLLSASSSPRRPVRDGLRMVSVQSGTTPSPVGGVSTRRPRHDGPVIGRSSWRSSLLFFVIPLVWLLLAATKTTSTLIVQQSRSPFGSFGDLTAQLERSCSTSRTARSTTWLAQLGLYSLGALVITLVVTHPGRVRAGADRVPRPAAAAGADARGDADARHGAGAADLPGDERGRPGRQPAVGDPAVLVLPVRRLPDLHLLLHQQSRADLLAAARIDGCGEFQVFTRIALPLATPVVALVAFFSFVAELEQLLPAVRDAARSSDGYPMQVGLTSAARRRRRRSTRVVSRIAVGAPAAPSRSRRSSSVLPVLIVFLVLQRFLVAGMTAGGTKE